MAALGRVLIPHKGGLAMARSMSETPKVDMDLGKPPNKMKPHAFFTSW